MILLSSQTALWVLCGFNAAKCALDLNYSKVTSPSIK